MFPPVPCPDPCVTLTIHSLWTRWPKKSFFPCWLKSTRQPALCKHSALHPSAGCVPRAGWWIALFYKTCRKAVLLIQCLLEQGLNAAFQDLTWFRMAALKILDLLGFCWVPFPSLSNWPTPKARAWTTNNSSEGLRKCSTWYLIAARELVGFNQPSSGKASSACMTFVFICFSSNQK